MKKDYPNAFIKISIHAPREGGDGFGAMLGDALVDFNPRPPRGGRLLRSRHTMLSRLFQSTPPARGATFQHAAVSADAVISIHAPREGGDSFQYPSFALTGVFPSPPPARGATGICPARCKKGYISIHAPREGGDFSKDFA